MLPDRSSEIEHYTTLRNDTHNRLTSIACGISLVSLVVLGVSIYYEVISLTVVSLVVALGSLLSLCDVRTHNAATKDELDRIMSLTIYEAFRQHYNHYIEEPSERRAMVAYNAWKKSPDIPFSRGDLARKFAADGIPVFVRWQEGQSVTGVDDVSD